MRIIEVSALAILALGLAACQQRQPETPAPAPEVETTAPQVEEVAAPPVVREAPAPAPAPERQVEGEPPASAPAAPAEEPAPEAAAEPTPEPTPRVASTPPPATSVQFARVRQQMIMTREAIAARDTQASLQHLEEAVNLARASDDLDQVGESLPDLLELSLEVSQGMGRPDTDEQEEEMRRAAEVEARIMEMMAERN